MWKGRTIRKIVAVVLAVLMTGMLLTACTENKNGQQDAADAEDYIKVGIVIPQTGVPEHSALLPAADPSGLPHNQWILFRKR